MPTSLSKADESAMNYWRTSENSSSTTFMNKGKRGRARPPSRNSQPLSLRDAVNGKNILQASLSIHSEFIGVNYAESVGSVYQMRRSQWNLTSLGTKALPKSTPGLAVDFFNKQTESPATCSSIHWKFIADALGGDVCQKTKGQQRWGCPDDRVGLPLSAKSRTRLCTWRLTSDR